MFIGQFYFSLFSLIAFQARDSPKTYSTEVGHSLSLFYTLVEGNSSYLCELAGGDHAAGLCMTKGWAK